jgi:hypothetical protein
MAKKTYKVAEVCEALIAARQASKIGCTRLAKILTSGYPTMILLVASSEIAKAAKAA